jgi:hypothetical protein
MKKERKGCLIFHGTRYSNLNEFIKNHSDTLYVLILRHHSKLDNFLVKSATKVGKEAKVRRKPRGIFQAGRSSAYANKERVEGLMTRSIQVLPGHGIKKDSLLRTEPLRILDILLTFCRADH